MVAYFATTSWSTVLAAKDGRDTESDEALNSLCRVYWPPLYSHIRRKGYPEEDAKDLTQEFFSRLIERDFLQKVDQGQGRFRTFLLACLDNFLMNEWKRSRTQKRGGGVRTLSLDLSGAEERHALSLADNLDPRILFDRRWAQTLLGAVLARLDAEFLAAGKSEVFNVLKVSLVSGEGDVSYRTLSGRLNMSEGAVKVAVHRMRRRYAALLREEIAKTVENTDDVEEELKYLIEVMGAR